MKKTSRLGLYGFCGVLSVLALALAALQLLPEELGGVLEMFAVVSGAWSVWFLSRNQVSGWWLALVSNVLFGFVFFRVQLFAEVGIQVFYFITGLQAIWIWLHGGKNHEEKPVGRATRRLVLWTLPLAVAAFLGLRVLLLHVGGAAPTWDALTTVLSLTAHVYLMWRLVDSWSLWILVDLIYMPLYVSRGLWLTAGLYAAFLLLSVGGLVQFRRQLATTSAEPDPMLDVLNQSQSPATPARTAKAP